uniref:Trs120/TRAPPC9 N-terminal domain-containing protein n=1 Tax=Glossina pallidipes TaxID=7398 RepID=A0A1A9ZEY3_GLOPL
MMNDLSIWTSDYLLVLLRGVGPSKPRTLQKAFDKVRGVNNVKITDSNGLIRDIWVRYIHDHPVENNDWGDFQTQRRLLGLLTNGKFETQIELNELCRQHESLKVRYGTLYETRAIFFGPPIPEESAIASSSTAVTNHNDLETIKENPCPEIKISLPKRLQDEYTTPPNFKAQAFFYRGNDLYEDLETHIVDFPEKCGLLTAPFEKREVVGLDRDSRNSKKCITGRTLINLADLSLQAGLIEDALSLYHNACETLKSIIDFLWEGAAEEGLCAASALLLYPHLRTEETLHRNASLQVGSPLKNTPEKWRSSDLTKRVTTSDKHNHEHSDILSPPPHSASTSSVLSILSNSTLSQTSSSSSSTSTSTISAAHPRGQYSELLGNILKAEEIPIYFHKALINYSKYGYAAVVEIEASFKPFKFNTA